MYLTGLRANEVLNFELWQVDEHQNLIVQTLKKSNPRTFSINEVSSIFADLLIYDNTRLITFNYKYLQRHFNKFVHYQKLYTGNKKISTHLFRHNKAKQLKQSGFTDIQIQTYLGEKDIKNALTYINSDIYYI